MRELLEQGLRELGLPERYRSEEKLAALEAFARLVLDKNRVMNLTAITAEADFARLHLLDSAALLQAADFQGRKVIDVGTGAGFPGVPLRVLCDSLHMTLLDSTGKRVEFLREACAALKLNRIEPVQARAEEYAASHREEYDLAVSRAVASLPVLCELCLPLVRPGGSFLAMKSTQSEEELRESEHAIRTLGGTLRKAFDYEIPGGGMSHRVYRIDKTSPTPPRYPRSFGQIKKKPL